MKFNDALLEAVSLDLQIGAVPALMGEPGIGKSSFVIGLAHAMDTQAFVLACNQLADKADLTGGRLVPYTTPNGETDYKQVFYPHQVISDAIAYATANPREWPILFLDEINRSTSDVTSAALSLPTLRSIGSMQLPPNLRIVVAGNNKGNVVTLDEASLSRFSIYNVEPDAGTLVNVLGDGLNSHVKTVILRFPHLIFERSAANSLLVDGADDDDDTTTATYSDLLDAGDEMLQLTTPRTINAISDWLNVADPVKLQEYLQTPAVIDGRETTLLNELIEAHIGNTEFAKHLIAEIATGLSSGATQQATTQVVPKPNCYASLKAATTVTDLENVIAGLTEHEKSGSLLFALSENTDNKVLVQQLAQQLTSLEGEHNRIMVTLAASSSLDIGNMDALLATSTPVGEHSRIIFASFV